MQGSLDRPPIVFTSARWKSALRAIGALGFVLLGGWLVTLGEPKPVIAGVASIGCFGWFLVLGVAQLLRPSTLKIGPSGVSLCGPFRTTAYRWQDIENIRVIEIKRAKGVGFDLTETYQGSRALASLSQGVSGVEAGLPAGWTVGPEALARLLNEARERWLDANASVPTEPPSRRMPAPRDPTPIAR